MRLKLYIISLFILSGLLYAENTLSLEDNGDGTWNVNYSSEVSISSYTFTIDGADVVDYIIEDTESFQFGWSCDIEENTITWFSLNHTIPEGTGLLLILTIDGTPSGMSDITVLDNSETDIDFTFDNDCAELDDPDGVYEAFGITCDQIIGFYGCDQIFANENICEICSCSCDCMYGCTDDMGCNYDADANVDDGGCEYAMVNYDCDGNCTAEIDCAGDCGGDAEIDQCGICEGDGIPDGDCDCQGNIDDCTGECGGDAEIDECGICEGDGIPSEECDCNGNIDDCAGECGGSAMVDACGECGGTETDPDNCGGGWDGDACSMPVNTVHLTSAGDVLFNTATPIAGFQMEVDGGATIVSAGDGAAGDAGFMISASGNTVLGFSLTGATFEGCGTIVELELDGEATGLSGIVISDSNGNAIPFEYFDGNGGNVDILGCMDDTACNYNPDANLPDDCIYAEENYDCDGNCTAETDCADECGGSAELDECGVCNGSGADVECSDGSFECDIIDCVAGPICGDGICNGDEDAASCPEDCDTGGGWDGDACSMPDHTVHVTSSGSVLYNTSTAVAGFQMDLDGATILSAGGGDAGDAGFMISSSATTFLGFSLDGSTIEGCGTMVELELDGDATGLSGIIISDSDGELILFEYFDGTNNPEGPVCGDGVCEGDENQLNCPEDCNGGSAWDGDPCNMPDSSLHVTSTGSVLYNTSTPIAGFQFFVDGATINEASGGAAGDAGFMISASESTVLAFSLTGATFDGCGTMVELDLNGVSSGLSEIVVSNNVGGDLEFEYFDGTGMVDISGCMDDTACNYNPDANLSDDCAYAETNFDCEGNCIAELDCLFVCGGSVVEDECGICNGSGPVEGCGCDDIPEGFCDCDGNVLDCAGVCGGTAEVDECGECGGNGGTVECWDGGIVCEETDCSEIPQGTVEILYDSPNEIGSFKFEIIGVNVTNAYGGAAGEAGIVITYNNNMIQSNIFTEFTVPAGNGTLVVLEFEGNLNDVCISDGSLDFTESSDSDLFTVVDNCLTIRIVPCENDAPLDECGVCSGDSSSCTDCMGVINGDSVIDNCGVCEGDGISCAIYVEESINTTVDETVLEDMDTFENEFELLIESQLLLPEGSVEVTSIIIESRDNLNITIEFTIILTEEELDDSNFTTLEDLIDAWTDIEEELTTDGLVFIYGCTETSACNFDLDANATINDGSCFQFDCTYDPNDDSTWEGACGGTVVYDQCGVCGGPGCHEDDCALWPSESFNCEGYNLADIEFLQAFVDSGNLVIEPLTFGTQAWSNNGRLNTLIIQNMFSGTDFGDSLLIPENIGNLDSLTSLVIQNNSSLIGNIPVGIGNLTKLTELNLQYNSLTGVIPDTIKYLVNLSKLKLRNNQFSGELSEGLCNLSEIDWSSSSFTIKNNYLCPVFPECIEASISYSTQCGAYADDEEPPEACDCVLVGCKDTNSCNFTDLCSEYACTDDGSCIYAAANYDCNENCIVDLDCKGECGGAAIIDDCGNCEGLCIMTNANYFGIEVADYIVCSNSENNEIIAGCDGVCGSPYMADECGNCSGDCSFIDPETEEYYQDSLMVCSENAGLAKSYSNPFYVDFLGRCEEFDTDLPCGDLFENAISSDMILLPDCANECGGTNIIDECGDCGGNNECLSLRELLIPEDYSVYNIYPNPFNPITNISYGIPGNVMVRIVVFDIHGNLVQTLINNYQMAGYHTLDWNATNHSSGLYFVKIIAGDYTNTQKLMLIK